MFVWEKATKEPGEAKFGVVRTAILIRGKKARKKRVNCAPI